MKITARYGKVLDMAHGVKREWGQKAEEEEEKR
jgi:hypothetical protein